MLRGWGMLSKPLIQFSVDGWSCVPSLIFDLRPNFGGGNEDNVDLFQKVPCHKKKGGGLLLMVPLSPTCLFFFLNKIKGMSIQVCSLLVSILGWVLLPFHQMVTIEIIFSYDRVDWQKWIIYICIYMYTHTHTHIDKKIFMILNISSSIGLFFLYLLSWFLLSHLHLPCLAPQILFWSTCQVSLHLLIFRTHI